MQARLDAVRERIAEATLGLVAVDGWGAATMARVAEAAGVAVGTVYGHFDGKDDLFAEVFRRAAGRELAQVTDAAAAAGEPVAGIEAALRVFATRALQGRRLAYALLAEPAGSAVEAERLVYRSGYRGLFEELLAGAVAAGALAGHDVEVVAAVLTGAMGEALVGPLSPVTPHGSEPDLEAQVDAVVAACMRALPAPPAGSD